MKNQKGITLIALIITIIVMLILVVVTVSIAMDKGIFSKAKTARDDTAKEAEREELTSYVLGTYDGVTATVELGTIKTEITSADDSAEKWKDLALDNDSTPTKLTVVGIKSGTTWEINTSGTVKEK